MTSLGTMAQNRQVLEQVADAAIAKYAAENPRQKEAAVPPPLKWAAGIVAGLFTAGIAALAFWLVTSVSSMQVTLARMDERMSTGSVKDGRFEDLERRVVKLESFHSGGAS